jgi:uncharacterized heparinase superfamily protein
MEEFVACFSHPDGTVPQIGDNDSGKILPLRTERPVTPNASRAFSDAGFYSMRGRNAHVFISAAMVGMHGFGSHSHNDVFSFEYWYDGRAWIIDPGTYVYLPHPDARNWFRSTAAHNTVAVDEAEINPFHPEAVFQMVDQARVGIGTWQTSAQSDILEAFHTGYERLSAPITHRRRFDFNKETARLLIHDALEGQGQHRYDWFLQMHPSISVDLQPDMAILSSGTQRLRVQVDCPGARVKLVEGWYSRRYGHRERTTRLVAQLRAAAPISARITIEPC